MIETGWAIRVDGIVASSVNLPIERLVNGAPGSRINPAYGDIWQILSEGEARNRMLTLGLRGQSRAAFFDAHYTLASREATNDLWFVTTPVVDTQVEDFSGEMGPAAWDERHRVVLLAGAEAPLGARFCLKFVYASARQCRCRYVSRQVPLGDGRSLRSCYHW